MTRKTPGTMTILLVLLLALSGCGLHALTNSPSTPATPPGSATVSASSSANVADPLEASISSAPTADRDPAYAAQRFLLTWARPDLPYHDWWPAVAPLLNPEGRQDYAPTDPAELPVLTLTGPPTVQPSDIPTSVTVWQPSSRGRFGVRLTRTSPTAAWLVAELDFPPGMH
ncbi:MAG: hypothetical protein J2P57_01615 [Acidimicrobiaceae bacterium]|nr:hypothetical protein [Acidimicrobiaceae bacterium]